MIQELVELSKRVKTSQAKGSLAHDALDNVSVSVDCVIDRKGNFKEFIPHSQDKPLTVAERITAKKGKARLLVDKPEEVLKYGEKADAKHRLFLEKIKLYSHLKELAPVVAFYESNRANGITKARAAFGKQLDEKERAGNIAFLLAGDKKRLHEQAAVFDAVIEEYEKAMGELKSARFSQCSVCGSTSNAIADLPHGMIKRVPDGSTMGCALISYNDSAFESYALKGNENSSICTRCAKAYVDAMNWLLAPQAWIPSDKKGKLKPVFKNRKDISPDTAVVFWLREAVEANILDMLDHPTEESVKALFDSVFSGKKVSALNSDTFYAITLSGAAARIAIRDWIETSLESLQANLAAWFQDIEIAQYDSERKSVIHQFPRFSGLVWSARSKSTNDVQHGRIGATLWKCAVMGHPAPLWLLSMVLSRIRAEQGRITAERASLLKLYLNRKLKQQGGTTVMATPNELNSNIAYTCGQLFAVLESIQYHALGGDINAGIRERFFSFASTMPSTAFGRLMKMTQHHLSKIRGEKPGLAVNLDKKLQALIGNVEGMRFPAVFALEDQASFAIGYYHQRQQDFASTSTKKED